MFASNRQINQSMHRQTNRSIFLHGGCLHIWSFFSNMVCSEGTLMVWDIACASKILWMPIVYFWYSVNYSYVLAFFICQLFLCLSFCVHLSLLEWWKSVVCQLCQFSGSQQFHRIVDCKHPHLANLVIIKVRASKLSYDSQLPNELLWKKRKWWQPQFPYLIVQISPQI